MGLIKEFREFALKGSVVDLAVGIVIGAAFGKIVSSTVDDILMPVLGIVVGKHDFSDYFITLSAGHYDTLAQARAAGAATLNYGVFVNALVNFTIIAAAIFLVVRQVNRMRRKPAEGVTPSMRDCPECLAPVPREAHRCRFCTQPLKAIA
jgi:large conductance mechanosensitive channel